MSRAKYFNQNSKPERRKTAGRLPGGEGEGVGDVQRSPGGGEDECSHFHAGRGEDCTIIKAKSTPEVPTNETKAGERKINQSSRGRGGKTLRGEKT